jgi:catalase
MVSRAYGTAASASVTKAQVLAVAGKETPAFVRFSTVLGLHRVRERAPLVMASA